MKLLAEADGDELQAMCERAKHSSGSCPAPCSPSRSKYKTILADPPWEQEMIGKFSKMRRHCRATKLPYPTMTVQEICALPIGELADDGAHLWLWTTNKYLRAGFDVMDAWGFKYLAPITWVKPSGCGAWFVHRTQTLLFGYRKPLRMRERYKPTVLATGLPSEHSAKPNESYELIESISDPARVEIFARPWTPMFPRRDGWDVWGNEVPQDVALVTGDWQSCGHHMQYWNGKYCERCAELADQNDIEFDTRRRLLGL